jgi:putative addiction module antidote
LAARRQKLDFDPEPAVDAERPPIKGGEHETMFTGGGADERVVHGAAVDRPFAEPGDESGGIALREESRDWEVCGQQPGHDDEWTPARRREAGQDGEGLEGSMAREPQAPTFERRHREIVVLVTTADQGEFPLAESAADLHDVANGGAPPGPSGASGVLRTSAPADAHGVGGRTPSGWGRIPTATTSAPVRQRRRTVTGRYGRHRTVPHHWAVERQHRYPGTRLSQRINARYTSPQWPGTLEHPMTRKLKVTAIGNSTGVILPRDLLARLRVGRGDELTVLETPNGITLTPFDPELAAQMEAAEEIMRRRRNLLRKLAE